MAVVAVANVLSSGSGGEVPAITVFRDSFNRTSGGLGPDWFSGNQIAPTPLNDDQFGNAQIAPITGGIQGLSLSAVSIASPTTTGQHYPLFAIPLKLGPVFSTLDSMTNRGFTQFAEWKMVHRAAPDINATLSSGPAVFVQIGDGAIGGPILAGYYFEVTSNPVTPINPGNICRVIAFADGMFRAVVAGSSIVADGDVMRIVITPSVASNFIEIFINGVSNGSAIDSDATRPLYGIPGFITVPFAGPLPVLQECNNFIAGLGDGAGISF